MSTKNVVKGDYKKWLLYSFEKQDFNNHYDLFKTLKEGGNVGNVRISKSIDNEIVTYTISHDDINDDLQIIEAQRELLKEYLTENYFKTEKIEELVHQKARQLEKSKNHNFFDDKRDSFDEEQELKVKVHPKESTYYGIKLIVSILFYVGLLGAIAYSAMLNISSLLGVALMLPILLLFWFMNKLFHGIFVGMIRGHSVQVTKEQFPDIYEIVEEQAAKLKIKKLPEIYITSGHFNAFVTRFSRSNIMLIYSEVIETTLNGNYDVLKYVTAHELCHIKQKHLSKEVYLLPSRLIPFLGLAYSRGREYTCDRVGYSLSPKGSIEGVLIMTTGKEIHSKLNIELHIKNSVENAGFWTWLSEKFLTHPHPYKRLVEIKQFSKYN